MHLRRTPGAQRLIERVLLIAEAAADVGLDDADIRPGTAQRLTDDTADDVRDLRGGDDDDAAVFLIGVAAVILDMAVLHGGRIVPALDLDESRLGDRLGVIALADVRVLEDIVRIRLVEQRRAVLHRLLHVQHEGQLLILDLQRAHALHRRDLVLRDDDGDVVAVIAHVAVQKVAVRNVLMPRVHRPGVARRRKAVLRRIKAREHLHDAGDGFCRGRVDGSDKSVRDGGVLDARIQRAGRHPILVVFRASGDLVERIHADLALSYLVHRSSSLSSVLPWRSARKLIYIGFDFSTKSTECTAPCVILF